MKPKPMKRVFVCSPLRGNYAKNIELAKVLCAIACREGHAPFAPHLLYTQFLSDEVTWERNAGISAGLAWLGQADELWIFARDIESCSEGMRMEIEKAESLVIPPRVVWMPKCWEMMEATQKAEKKPEKKTEDVVAHEVSEYGPTP